MGEPEMAEQAEKVPAPDKCSTCGDTGKVMLSLTGASGAFTRDVPCTECGAGILLTGGGPDVAALRRTMKQVALIALGAFILGLLAYLTGSGGPGPSFFKADLKKVTPPE